MGDAEARQRLAEGAEGVQDRIGIEAVGAVGGRQQRPGIDRDPGFTQRAQQHGVEVGGGVDLEIHVLAGVAPQAQRHRPHQDRGMDRSGAVLGEPGGLADAEVAGGQPDLLGMALGDLPDGAGMGAGVGQGPDLADQRGQARRTAARQELCQS